VASEISIRLPESSPIGVTTFLKCYYLFEVTAILFGQEHLQFDSNETIAFPLVVMHLVFDELLIVQEKEKHTFQIKNQIRPERSRFQ
jgi:hypothetical protein